MKSIIFGNNPVSLTDSLYITLVSMAIVFGVLIIISLVLNLMKYIPEDKKMDGKKALKKQKSTVDSNKTVPNEAKAVINYQDEKVRLAIMVASMEAAAEDENAYIRVRSVKEIA